MKIGILSNCPKCYSTIRLKQVAKKRGHSVRILSSHNFSLDIQPNKPSLYYNGKPLTKIDAIIPRVAASSHIFGISVLRQFEQIGVYCLNTSAGISMARDKLRSMQILSRHNIDIPHTAFIFDHSEIEPAIDRFGAPVIIKLLEGSQGAGVILAETKGMAKAIIQALQVAHRNVLIQKFVSESKGKDIRAFVVGGRVVAAMRRTAQEGEFRSNVHLGANTEAVQLTPEYELAAIKAAQIMGLQIAGVDLLESKTGPKVLEINSSPGLEGIEEATKIDVAEEIIKFLEEQIQFPEFDLRERLSLSKGYLVAEIPINKKSIFANKLISETNIKELEISILSITRNSITIPIPKDSEKLVPGDKVLCYGKQLALKSLLPEKKKSRRTALLANS